MQLLDTGAPESATVLERLIEGRRLRSRNQTQAVSAILEDVLMNGDTALCAYTSRFDGWQAASATLRVPSADIAAALAVLAPDVRTALETARDRIRAFHEKSFPENAEYTDAAGIRLGWRWSAVDAVGLYAPGGRAVYPSSVLMNVVPAQVAGVKRIALVSPATGGRTSPAVLAAAALCGVDEVYRIGGAQAIAALAYGTRTIARVDKISGPGNQFVTEAKRQVFGTVGIDMAAGPSEVMIVADDSADPRHLAVDLLAQAEHDPEAQSILVTLSRELAQSVAAAVDTLLARGDKPVAAQSWRDWGLIVVAPDTAAVVALVNRVAPEHLELAVENPSSLLPLVRHAGSVFAGHRTAEALGDYVAGPNHVLPTCGAARFSSGLSVTDFMKRSTIIDATGMTDDALLDAGAILATQEGLPMHALSLTQRRRT